LILKAFSEQLQLECNRERKPEHVLFDWLARTLLMPPAPDDVVGKVLHAEIEMIDCNGYPGFEGKNDSGCRLLESLFQFCRSYDHWQFSRWLHEIRASDFSEAGLS
jgi:hypothetical protein